MKLVTGGNGFLGNAVLTRLKEEGVSVRGVVRNPVLNHHVPVVNIGPETDWTSIINAVDVVIHTAARVHIMNDHVSDPFACIFLVGRG